jgi:glycine betaine/choline ABC-type transport system substrate-binding protein
VRTPRRTPIWVGLALVVALAGCDAGSAGPGSVQPQGESLRLTLGTKDFTESVIMGELYAQALENNGYQVVLRKNVGPTEVIDAELQDGEIDAYPEYLGVAATVVAGEDVEGKSADETRGLAQAFYESRGQVLSAQTPFENVDAIATTFLFAQRHQLRAIGDLRRLDSFTLGARPEFETRQQGFAGMQRVYRLTNGEFVPVDIGARYVALFEGDVDVANVFSTDPQLADGDFRLLEDPERIFGYQHVALVIDEDKLETLGGDEFMDVIDSVNRQLSQRTVIDLNAAVDLDNRDAVDVAGQFLRQRGLVDAESE